MSNENSDFALMVVLFGSTQLSAKDSQSIKAINYKVQGGSTTVDFVGTEAMPKARGEAKVESKKGYIEIEVEFKDLGSPTQFGTEYLTYVLWAVSPEGRTVNLGELVVKDGKAKLNVTSDLQVFAMGVTAEPYFAVRRPSSAVVMKNEPRKSTQGKVFVVDAKVDLLERGALSEARQSPGNEAGPENAPGYVPGSQRDLGGRNGRRVSSTRAISIRRPKPACRWPKRRSPRKLRRKTISTQARQAVQFSEDARALAAKRQEEERIAQEKADAAAKAKARSGSQSGSRSGRSQAQGRCGSATPGRAGGGPGSPDESRGRSSEAESQSGTGCLEGQGRDGKRSSRTGRRAETEREKQALRASLLEQFNRILSTRDTPRGLVVTMADVLFDTGKYDLRPEARERLARLSGIVLAHPGLNLEVEGHTDSTGGDELNQKLSEQRAGTTREYLIQQGLADGSITAKGYGKTMPVADNSTAQGRQQNRRVELIISGEVIGAQIGAAKANP